MSEYDYDYFIAGPMRGHRQFNFPAFDACEEYLRLCGQKAFSPAAADRADGFNPVGMRGTDEELDYATFDIQKALARNFDALEKSRAIIMLPGWAASAGALAELEHARKLGLPVGYFDPSGAAWKDRPDPLPADELIVDLRVDINGTDDGEVLGLLQLLDSARDDVKQLRASRDEAIKQMIDLQRRLSEAQRPRAGDLRFHAALEKIADLHDAKQADYGSDHDAFGNLRASEAFGIPAWIGAMIRANDKVSRIQTATTQVLRGEQVRMANEALVDSFEDLAVYALIAKILYEETLEEALVPWTQPVPTLTFSRADKVYGQDVYYVDYEQGADQRPRSQREIEDELIRRQYADKPERVERPDEINLHDYFGGLPA